MKASHGGSVRKRAEVGRNVPPEPTPQDHEESEEKRSSTPHEMMEQWALVRLVPDAGTGGGKYQRVNSTALFQDFVAYCRDRGCRCPLTQTAWGRWMGKQEVGTKKRIEGLIYYAGISLLERGQA